RPDDWDRRHARVLAGEVLLVLGLLLLLLLLLVVLLLLLLLLLDLLLHVLGRARVAVVLLAVRRQLDFFDRRIVRFLLCERVALRVHHVQVVVAAEDHGLLVRRHRRPPRLGRRLVIVV